MSVFVGKADVNDAIDPRTPLKPLGARVGLPPCSCAKDVALARRSLRDDCAAGPERSVAVAKDAMELMALESDAAAPSPSAVAVAGRPRLDASLRRDDKIGLLAASELRAGSNVCVGVAWSFSHLPYICHHRPCRSGSVAFLAQVDQSHTPMHQIVRARTENLRFLEVLRLQVAKNHSERAVLAGQISDTNAVIL